MDKKRVTEKRKDGLHNTTIPKQHKVHAMGCSYVYVLKRASVRSVGRRRASERGGWMGYQQTGTTACEREHYSIGY